jgi:hypothetical protein
MPEPIPDVNRDHQCYHYQAPGGERCGSPALKGEYYCYHHHIKNANRNNRRVLIDPEVTCMELPLIEDRASIFVALAAVVHRLGQNTIDTRRAGQMIYGLQVALRALEPPRPQRSRISPAADPASESQPIADTTGAASSTACAPDTPAAVQLATNNQQPATSPTRTIPISKEGLLYFLRSRHCATCNAELFPAAELTERPNPGAPPAVIEEARPALPAPNHSPDQAPDEIPALAAGTLPHLEAVAEQDTGILRCAQNDRQKQKADPLRELANKRQGEERLVRAIYVPPFARARRMGHPRVLGWRSGAE